MTINGYDAPMSLRLLQLSDCHLKIDPADNYRGINPEFNLGRVLKATADWQPDALILSGDLAEHATEEVYQRLNGWIAPLQIPAMAFPGNHDDFAMMQKTLTDQVFVWHNPWIINGWQLVWLDSNLPQQPAGDLDQKKLSVLDTIDPKLPTILSLHHQPVAVGTPWIDRFKLQNPELLWHWLESHPHSIKAIAWGHIHHGWHGEKLIGNHRIQLLGAPSASACAVPGCEEFKLDTRGPRARWFNLSDDGVVNTGLLGVG